MLRYLFLLLVILMPFLAQAKNDSFIKSASIIADSIEIDANGNLTAKGNVDTVSYTHLRAHETR